MVSARLLASFGSALAAGLCAVAAYGEPVAAKPAAGAAPSASASASAPAAPSASFDTSPAPSASTPAPTKAAPPAKPAEHKPAAAASAAPAASAPAATTAPPHSALPSTPRLHHGPVALTPAHQPFQVKAAIDHPELVKRAILVYRTAAEPTIRELEFRRSAAAPYVAEVPEAEVLPVWLEYAVELETLDGARLPVFASREHLHRVEVPDDLADARERALLTRLDGRRSVFFGSGEFVTFGSSSAQNQAGTTSAIRDSYYRVEAGYTYRPLRLVTEFSLRAGIVRGRSPVALGGTQAPGNLPEDRFKVGLNYGAPSVRLRLTDLVHLEAEFLTSVTEVGFSLGTGGALLFGDPYGSKLTLGFETIHVFGNRFYSRMDIVATPRLTVSPIVEVTNMPHADDYGVRLLGELSFDAGGGFGLSARGGYQARTFTEGGPSGGLGLRYAF